MGRIIGKLAELGTEIWIFSLDGFRVLGYRCEWT